MRANIKNKKSFAKKFTAAVAISAAVVLFFAIMTIAGLVIYMNADVDIDENALLFENSLPDVYDDCGDLTAYCAASRSDTPIDQIPKHLKDAFVALEDKRFYDHHGVDYIRIMGAFVANLKSGRRAQGGSTITQQIAKNAFLTSEKSFSRKLKEARIAVSLERRMTKDEILETYLNMLYFGSGEYGVKNAARRFFGCEVSELTLAQSAMLAGIVKSPTKYNPINHYDNALSRSRLVLSLMKEQGKITDEEYSAALSEEIAVADDKSALELDKTYVVNALEEGCKILGVNEKELRARGYRIYTYLRPERQAELKKTVDDKSYYSAKDALCAALDVDVATGGIRAAYSTFSANFFDFRRQAGSVLKPLVCYAPAFESGLLSPASVLTDEPCDFNGYSPKNYGDKYYGKVSAREALAYSLNVPAVAVLQSVGVQRGYDTLKELGFSLSENDDNLSLALGSTSNGTSLCELATGFSTLANGGVMSKATFVKRIEDQDGNTVYDNSKTKPKRVFSRESCYLTTNSLIYCAKNGTAKKLASLPFQVASKTGTVAAGDGNADAYDVSYTTRDCVLFWQGSENYANPLPSNVTGGGLPALMCKNYMAKICASPEDFEIPDGITQLKIDKIAYEKGEIVLSSDFAPEKFVITEIFDVKFADFEKNDSFDYPKAMSVEAQAVGNEVSISFTSDPHLCYKVIKKSLFADDRIILDVRNEEGNVKITDKADGLFGYNRYVIVPYYFDDKNRETIGEIYQIPVGW